MKIVYNNKVYDVEEVSANCSGDGKKNHKPELAYEIIGDELEEQAICPGGCSSKWLHCYIPRNLCTLYVDKIELDKIDNQQDIINLMG
jgi:hypothetical protein